MSALRQKMIDDMYGRFVSVVVKGRPMLDEKKVRELADGRIYTAHQALEARLIDRLGYFDDAIDEAIKIANLPAKAKVIVYRRSENKEDNIYNSATAQAGAAEGDAVSAAARQVEKLMPPHSGFYYMWLPGIK